MKKIFIEDQRVESFLADLRNQLAYAIESCKDAGIETFTLLGVGESGTQMARLLLNRLEENPLPVIDANSVRIASVQKKEAIKAPKGVKADEAIPASEAAPAPEQLRVILSEDETYNIDEIWGHPADNKPTNTEAFLVIDGVCRSGMTLTAVYSHLRKYSTRVWTYAIAVSADSAFIPSWYGCLYESSEYVMLVRDGVTPNTALAHQSREGRGSPALVLRPPLEGDPEFHVGEDALSIARYKSDDRFFDSTTRSKHIMVLEWDSVPAGFVAYHVENKTLWIHYIVSCQDKFAKIPGVGTALYYHVENYAKLRGCDSISLWAIDGMVLWYEKRGFAKYSNSRSITIGNQENKPEKYWLMTNQLLADSGHYRI